MIKCPNCGSLNYEENNFCGKCGAQLPDPKICPNCQLQSFENDYCINCGHKLISFRDFNKMNELMDDAGHLWLFDKDYLHAIRKYDRVLNIFPYHIKALNDKGICFSRLNKYDEAIYCLDKVLEIDSNNLNALKYKGDCFKDQYMYDKAIDCYNKVLRIDSNNQSAFKSKANVLLSMRKYDEVPEILSKIKPERAFYWIDLSNLYLKVNDFDNALKCLDNVDENEWADLSKFNIFKRLGKYDLIIQKCNEKLNHDSNNASALKIKAKCLSSLKKFEESITCYEKLLRINPNDTSSIFDKVRILLELNKYDEVKCILSQIKPEKYYEDYLSKYYLEINEVDESSKYLNKYLENHRYFSPRVVDIYLKSNQFQTALKYCNKSLKTNPNDYVALCSKGDCYKYMEKFDEALECYDKAISINKYGSLAYFRKIDLFIKLDEYSNAKQVLLNMNDENSFNYWRQLSKYYVQLKDFDKALECINKAINLNYDIEYLVEKAEILYNLENYTESMDVCMKASKLNSEYDKLIEVMEKINTYLLI